ncbi:ArnT family glycosyltransferase [Neolewinella litorea]|nr:glycosyltransferase family 39 protein [Neolewinella litorea]
MQALPRDVRPLWLLTAWLLLNMLQAGLTPLDPDETYYWMYAGDLDWGYFDHPPAVALLVSLGRDWLPGALGLRFGHVLASTAAFAVVYELAGRPRGGDLWLLAGLLFAQPMLQVYGFIATPDGPLLLFTALYLLAYRNFLDRPTLGQGAVWGLTMAGLMYSKYHGAVIILFSVLPNLAFLLRRPGAWLAALGGAALFLPHLYWQYVHDYPSFRYHLSGRDDPYRFSFTVQYIANQLLIFSPLLLYHYWLTFRRDHARDAFERACRWLIAGFLLFFLYTTTKGRTEAQWTAALAIPLVYLTFRFVQRFPNWQSGLWRMCVATGLLLVVARLLLMAPRAWLPFEKPFDHAPWVAELSHRAGDMPVIFEDSYRLASLYEFYSGGKPAWTFTDVAYRPNQYDLWQRDTSFQGDSVLIAGQKNWNWFGTIPFKAQKSDLLLRPVADFQVARLTQLQPAEPLPAQLATTGSLDLELYAASPVAVDFETDWPIRLFAILMYPDGERLYWPLEPLAATGLPAGREVLLYSGQMHLPPNAPTGSAQIAFGLAYRGMPPLRGQIPSHSIELVVGK